MKSLLVDDQGVIRESLRLLLKAARPDMEVFVAATQSEARKILSEHQFDFIFMDIEMKEGRSSGIDFLKQLKDDSEQTASIIMLSGRDDRETVMDAINNGAVGFITKNGDNVIPKAIDVVLKGGIFLPDTMRGRGGTTPPPGPFTTESIGTVIKAITETDLGVSRRVYETLYYVSLGDPYKTIGSKMSIEEGTAQENAENGYKQLRVKNKVGFLVMLNRRGWRLQAPVKAPLLHSQTV